MTSPYGTPVVFRSVRISHFCIKKILTKLIPTGSTYLSVCWAVCTVAQCSIITGTSFRASDVGRGATLHQKVVVTGVGDIWRVHGARAYNGCLGQSPSGVQGQSPWWGAKGAKPPEAVRFYQNNVNICT